MKRFYFSKLITPVVILLAMCSEVLAQSSTTFNLTGSPQYYTVPAGVTSVQVQVWGGQGANSNDRAPSYHIGGLGSMVVGTMNVVPGQVLQVNVGGAGSNTGTGGYNGGGTAGNSSAGGGCSGGFAGGGGGASDIRNNAPTYGLADRLVVAAGGGGSGRDYCNGSCVPCGCGGSGGGGDVNGTCAGNCGFGYPGGCTNQGLKGLLAVSANGGIGDAGGANGSAGTLGIGGTGAAGSYDVSGGGGGGGYYGGGGGGSASSGSGVGGGGAGGGSSYTGGLTGGAITAATNSGDGKVIITPLCVNPGTITGPASVCVGSSVTLANTTSGGSWVSSSTSVATIGSSTGVLTGVASGTVTITYVVANPCGGSSATYSVTVNPAPASITGTTSVCAGLTTALADITPSGTWASSNPAIAAVGSSSGIVTGVASGSATITYTLPTSCFVTALVTVSSSPAPITGTAAMCASGGTSTLSDLVTGGTWTSASPSIATIGALTGVVTGVTAGTAVISYAAPVTGCVVTTTVTINPLPPAITGVTNACVGASSTLSNGMPGGTWATSNPSLATVIAGTGVVTGVFAGLPTITYTLSSTGCFTTIPFLVNPNPSSIVGIMNICINATSTLFDASGGGTWSSSAPAIATIGSTTGLVAGITAGTSVITYTLPTSCKTSTTVTVNLLPQVYAVTGGGSYCAGGGGVHVGLSFSNTGVNYILYRGTTFVSSLPGGSSSLDFGAQTIPGTYIVTAANAITGCTDTMTGSAVVNINPGPNVYTVTGGGSYCAGGAGELLGLSGSDVGVNYQLYNGPSTVGAPYPGTGASLSFGTFTSAGSYTVVATSTTTGCTALMSGSGVITVNPTPTVYAVTGGGAYCAGGAGLHIILGGSDPGTSYQLYLGSTATGGPVSGLGIGIDFGLFTSPGVYTVKASDGSGCNADMSGSASITVYPLPTPYTVTGGGNYCAGGAGVHIGLNFSSTGIKYYLWNGLTVVDSAMGSGAAIDFGIYTALGTYTVSAVNVITGCQSNMTGSASIGINLPPIMYTITGGGPYCIGTSAPNIGTNLSEGGVTYQLYLGTTAIGSPIPGTGSALSFGTFTTPGTYTAVAVNPVTSCATTLSGSVTVTANMPPPMHTVTGGGTYCAGGTGVNVMLNGSDMGINYELFNGTLTTGIVLSGTGSPINFGPQGATGVYIVVATDASSGCFRNMAGSATVNINPAPTLFDVIGGGNYCTGGTGVHIGLTGSSTGVSYQAYNIGASGTPLSGSGLPLDFGAKTVAGTYTVIGTNLITGCTATMNGSAIVGVDPLPANYILTGGGRYCSTDPGLTLTLSGSDEGVNYQLYRSGSAFGSIMPGAGTAMIFGPVTSGLYNVVGTDATTGCSRTMSGLAAVTVVSPAVYAVTGGGSYCAGAPGVHVGLTGSSGTQNYQLYIGGVATGAPVPGSGLGLDFGLQTTAAAYTIKAVDTALGCVTDMAGSVTINVNPLPVVNNVTGTGSYCAGDPGLHVRLDGSVSGIQYRLYRGTTAVGAALPGSGSALDFGLQTIAGTYTVIATNPATTCASNMADSAVITVKPLPYAFMLRIANDGYYCAADTAGVHIFLDSSNSGVNYSLYRSTTLISTAAGTGSMLDFGGQRVAGTYTVVAHDTGTTCSSNMTGAVTVIIIPLPTEHNMTGGGGYCAGGAGMHIGLDGSDPGIYYELFNGPYSGGSLMGTGAPLDFGLQIAVGGYRVIANSVITNCPNLMLGNATIYHDSLPTPYVTLRAFPGTGIGVWHVDSIQALVTNGGTSPSYQWMINGNIIPGATNESFTNHEFFNKDSVTCMVTASGPCGGNTSGGSLVLHLYGVGVSNVSASAADIRLVPNPNRGAFTLKGSTGTIDDQDAMLEVSNMLGQVIYTDKVTTKSGRIEKQVNLGEKLANGMYILSLRSESMNLTFHFVVEQ